MIGPISSVTPPRRFTPRLLPCFFFALLLRLSANMSVEVQPMTPSLPGIYPPGSPITLSVADIFASTTQLTWMHDGSPIPDATGPTLVLENPTSADTGNYRLRITRGTSVEYSGTATVNVLAVPEGGPDGVFDYTYTGDKTGHFLLAATPGGGVLLRRVAYNETGAAAEIVRLNPDGSEDSSFHYPIEGDPSQDGILAVAPDGRLIVNSASLGYRLAPDGSSDPLVLPPDFDSTQPLSAAGFQPDGKLLIAQNKTLARLNSDDSLDPTFVYSSPLSESTSFFTFLRNPFLFDSLGRIYVHGRGIDDVPGHYPGAWNTVFRLLPSGAEDTSFARQVPHLLRGSVRVYPFADGRLLLYRNYKGSATWHPLSDLGVIESWDTPIQYFSTPSDPIVDTERGLVFAIEGTAFGPINAYRLTASQLEFDPGFYSGLPSAGYLMLLSNGDLLAFTYVPTRDLYRIRTDLSETGPPTATITQLGIWSSADPHFDLLSQVKGTEPISYQWLGLDDQPLPTDSTSAELTITDVQVATLGRYQLKVTDANGTAVLSNVVNIHLPYESYLSNLSGRVTTGQGENTPIAGLSVDVRPASHRLPVLLRGVGPTLKAMGLTEAIANPAIDLFAADGTLIGNNDQWSTDPTTADAAARVGAFPLDLDSNDSALLYGLPPGSATIALKPQGGSDGVGLLEIYQLPEPASVFPPKLMRNLSLRSHTSPGEGVAIAGFVIVDPNDLGQPAQVLLRVIGPSLTDFGITHPLEDPVLSLYNAAGELVVRNDDWAIANESAEATTLSSVMAGVGAFPLNTDSADAAVLLELGPGAYTMHADGGSGVVLVEIYLVN